MYCLKIRIYTDGDFSFENPYYKNDDEQHIFYSENRGCLTQIVFDIMSNLINSFSSHKDYDFNGIKNFAINSQKVVKKFETFYMEAEFGNQEMQLEIMKTKKIQHKCYFELQDDLSENHFDSIIGYSNLDNLEDLW